MKGNKNKTIDNKMLAKEINPLVKVMIKLFNLVFMIFIILSVAFAFSSQATAKSYISCIDNASKKYNVPSLLIDLIANKLESGSVGLKSMNSNGTYDMGIMQINSIHLKELEKYNVTENDLVNNACINIDVGTWILSKEILKTKSYAKGLGRYHSGNTKHATKYLLRAKEHLEKMK